MAGLAKSDPPSTSTPVRDDKLAQLVVRDFPARAQLVVMTADERSAMQLTAFRHLEQMARMVYLAPDIIRAILGGTQPKGLSGRAFWQTASMPIVWAEQRKVLGFPAA